MGHKHFSRSFQISANQSRLYALKLLSLGCNLHVQNVGAITPIDLLGHSGMIHLLGNYAIAIIDGPKSLQDLHTFFTKN